MKRLIITLFALFALAFAAIAQDTTAAPPTPAIPTVSSLLGSLGSLINPDTPIPTSGFFVFGGNQGANLTYGFAGCAGVSTLNSVCLNNSHIGSTNAVTLEGQQVVVAQHGFIGFINVNPGVAQGVNSTGFALQYGGGGAYNVSRLSFLKKYPGYWLGLRAGWDKRDVDDFVASLGTVAGAKAAIVPFARKTNLVFTFGKTFGK